MLFTKHSWRSGKCYVIGHVAILIPSFLESMTPLLWTKYEEKKTACRLTLAATQARVSTFWVEINFQKYLSIAKTTEKTVKTMPTKFPPWWWCHYIVETKRYTAVSRKVVRKNVHSTTPKGNMGYDQYTVPNDCSCRTYFDCFPLALANICPWPLVPFFQISLENRADKTTHNTFRDCRVHFFRQPFSKQLYT